MTRCPPGCLCVGRRCLQAVALVLLACVSLTSCTNTPPEVQPQLRSVRYLEVSSVEGQRLRTFPGTAKAAKESRLSFRVPGRLISVPARVGDVVRKGQLLAKLDPRDYELQAEEVKAALDRAKAEALNAQQSLDRVSGLYEVDHASKGELEAARAVKDSADAQVRAMEKKHELARRQAEYTRLTALADGIVAAVNVEVDENVAAGQPAVVLTSLRALEVEVDVPEGVISQIERGSAVAVEFDAIPGQRFAAEVTEVGVTPGPLTSTYPVVVRLVRSHAEIRPGMAAEVEFSLGAEEESGPLRVPPEAVAEDREGRFVYVVERTDGERGRVHRRQVEVGDIGSTGIEVLAGLDEGDLVVTAGVSRLEDGEEVALGAAGSD